MKLHDMKTPKFGTSSGNTIGVSVLRRLGCSNLLRWPCSALWLGSAVAGFDLFRMSSVLLGTLEHAFGSAQVRAMGTVCASRGFAGVSALKDWWLLTSHGMKR